MFNGLRRALASTRGLASRILGGSKGTATNAPPELDVIPSQRRAREKAAALHSPIGQAFPIRLAARRRALATTPGYALPGKPRIGSRAALELEAYRIEKVMRDAWEKRVDDGILKRAENEIRAAKVAFAREHGISRKAARRILNEMRRAGVHVVKIAAGTELERELVLKQDVRQDVRAAA